MKALKWICDRWDLHLFVLIMSAYISEGKFVRFGMCKSCHRFVTRQPGSVWRATRLENPYERGSL